MFHHKLKQVKAALVKWSRDSFGNIFQEIATLEDIIRVMEQQFKVALSRESREAQFKDQAELNVQLKRETEFGKQKIGLQWFKNGERNTKFFHILVKGKRIILKLKRIQNDEGEWLDDQKGITDAVVNFFQKQFSKE